MQNTTCLRRVDMFGEYVTGLLVAFSVILVFQDTSFAQRRPNRPRPVPQHSLCYQFSNDFGGQVVLNDGECVACERAIHETPERLAQEIKDILDAGDRWAIVAQRRDVPPHIVKQARLQVEDLRNKLREARKDRAEFNDRRSGLMEEVCARAVRHHRNTH